MQNTLQKTASAPSAAPVAGANNASASPSTASNGGLVAKLANRFGVAVPNFYKALMSVAFPSDQKISPEEMLALLVVCDQYLLNPFLKQIYAFKSGTRVVPLVGIDGWMSIILRHPDYKGIKIEMSEKTIKIDSTEIPAWCDCTILNRRLDMPVTMREYADEAFVRTSPVWKSHPKRMLRNRAIVQCARIAFGLGGISFVDNEANPWEAFDSEKGPAQPRAAEVPAPALAAPQVSEALIDEEVMKQLFEQGLKTGKWERINEMITSRYSPENQQRIRAYFYARRGAMKAAAAAHADSSGSQSPGTAPSALPPGNAPEDLESVRAAARGSAPSIENFSGTPKRRNGKAPGVTAAEAAPGIPSAVLPSADAGYLDALTAGMEETAMI